MNGQTESQLEDQRRECMAMRTIPIPGSLIDRGSCVEQGDDVVINFGVDGCFSRSKEGDDFIGPLPKGCVKAGKQPSCKAPPTNETVKWAFIDCSGALAEGTIDVKAACP